MLSKPLIMHFVHHSVAGGTEQQLALLTRVLPEVDHVVVLSEQTSVKSPYPPDVEQVVLKKHFRFDFRLFRIARLLRSRKPDVVHVWSETLLPVVVPLARMLGLFTVASFRNRYSFSTIAHCGVWLGALLSSRVCGNLPLDFQPKLYGFRLLSEKFYLIRNGVDIESLQQDATGVVPDSVPDSYFLWAARFEEQKRPLEVVRAFLAYRENGGEVDLVMAGRGALEVSCKQFVEQHGLSSCVQFLGFVENLPPVMKKAKAFVSVSAHEGMPNAVLESMALGVPLILSDIAEHRLLSEESAYYVTTNESRLVQQLAVAFEEVSSSEACSKATALSRKVVNELSVEAMAGRYLELYTK